MIVRRMTAADLDTVIALETSIFPDPWSRNSFEFELQSNRYSLPFILEDHGQILGYAIIWKIFEEFHIANIAIHPLHQGKGLGSFFLNEILKMAGGCKYALLEVRESNQRAIRLYQKFGFKTIMKRVRYYKNGETALVMQKIL